MPADGLREFEGVAKEYGLSPDALCPGYGMAEAALAVAIDPPTSPWSSVQLDPDALAVREWEEVAHGGVELVSCGPPVLHTEVRTAGTTSLGELEIRSPSLLEAYLGERVVAADRGRLAPHRRPGPSPQRRGLRRRSDG